MPTPSWGCAAAGSPFEDTDQGPTSLARGEGYHGFRATLHCQVGRWPSGAAATPPISPPAGWYARALLDLRMLSVVRRKKSSSPLSIEAQRGPSLCFLLLMKVLEAESFFLRPFSVCTSTPGTIHSRAWQGLPMRTGICTHAQWLHLRWIQARSILLSMTSPTSSPESTEQKGTEPTLRDPPPPKTPPKKKLQHVGTENASNPSPLPRTQSSGILAHRCARHLGSVGSWPRSRCLHPAKVSD